MWHCGPKLPKFWSCLVENKDFLKVLILYPFSRFKQPKFPIFDLRPTPVSPSDVYIVHISVSMIVSQAYDHKALY
ncbi:hypothetical protein HanIR_Chr13g0624281 [Helianthus annuus]|nr:hypothetical protein HanIR_Chr13g0624281 [Helianthus annuus]